MSSFRLARHREGASAPEYVLAITLVALVAAAAFAALGDQTSRKVDCTARAIGGGGASNPCGRGGAASGEIAVAGAIAARGSVQSPRREAAAGTDSRDLERATALIDREGASRAEARYLAEQLAALPDSILDQLEAQGTRVVATHGSVAAAAPALADDRPRGWMPGETFESVPGMYDPRSGRVVVALDGASIAQGAPPHLVAHEISHAIDYGGGGRSFFSSQRDFAEAYAATRFGSEDYFEQDGRAGREEAYAESMARFLADPEQLRREWPALYEYWKTHIDDVSGAPMVAARAHAKPAPFAPIDFVEDAAPFLGGVAQGTYESVKSTVELGVHLNLEYNPMVNPLAAKNWIDLASHPSEAWETVSALPGAMWEGAKQDWETLEHGTWSERGQVIGRFVPDAVLIAVTGGAGGAATRGARATATAATRLEDAATVAARTGAREGNDLALVRARGVDDLQGFCFTAGTLIHAGARGSLVPIERIRVGDRVLTLGGSAEPSISVDSREWRRVVVEMRDPFGGAEPVEVELLRSAAWIDRVEARVGAEIALELDELGLAGRARVEAIDDAPSVALGPGRVVLSTVASSSSRVLVLHFEGSSETLELTEGHRLFSVDRDAWVPARDLQAGERLRSADRPIVIAAIDRKPGVYRVYNFEVETEHSYLVSRLAIQSHNQNACAQPAGAVAARTTAAAGGRALAGDAERLARGVAARSGEDYAQVAERWTTVRNAMGQSSNPIQLSWELEGQSRNILEYYRPRDIDEATWSALDMAERRARAAGDSYYNFVRMEDAPPFLRSQLSTEAGGAVWETTTDTYASTAGELFGQATFVDRELAGGGFHWHVSFEPDAAYADEIVDFLAQGNEYTTLRMFASSPSNIHHKWLGPYTAERMDSIRGGLTRSADNVTGGDKFSTFSLRTGTYGDPARAGFEIRAINYDLDDAANAIDNSMRFLEDPSHSTIRFGSRGEGYRAADVHGVDRLSAGTIERFSPDVRDFLHRAQRAAGSQYKSERWAIPMVRWEERAHLAGAAPEVVTARNQFLRDVERLASRNRNRELSGTRAADQVENLVHVWSRTTRLWEHF